MQVDLILLNFAKAFDTGLQKLKYDIHNTKLPLESYSYRYQIQFWYTIQW